MRILKRRLLGPNGFDPLIVNEGVGYVLYIGKHPILTAAKFLYDSHGYPDGKWELRLARKQK